MSLSTLFRAHPESVGENYRQHLVQALKFSLTMGAGCIVCCVHALLPFLFEKTGSRLIEKLHTEMVTHRDRRAIKPQEPAGELHPVDQSNHAFLEDSNFNRDVRPVV